MRRSLLVGLAVLFLAVAGLFVLRANRTVIAEPPALVDTAGVEPAVVALVEERLAAVQADPGSREKWLALAMAYHANVLNALAAECYEQVLAMDDDDARTWYLFARAQAENGDLESAVEAARRSLALNRQMAPTSWQLASWLLDQGLTEVAETALNDASAMIRGAPAVLVGRARVHMQRGETAEAAALLEAVLPQTDPLNRDYVADQLAGAYRALGRPEDANRIAPAQATRRPRWPDPWTDELNRDRLLKVWVVYETDIALQGRTTGTLSKLQRLRAAGEYDPAILERLAQVLYVAGRRGEALYMLEDAVVRHPDTAALRVNLAVAYAEADRIDDAMPHMDAAIRLVPDNGSLQFQRGSLLLRQRKHAEAEQALRRAIELGYETPLLNARLGEALCKQQRYPEAGEFLSAAIAQEPRIASAHLWSARAQAETGALTFAVESLQRARQLGASGPECDEIARRIDDLQRQGRR